MLLHHLIYRAADRFGDKTAFGWVERDRTLTYAEAAAATDRVAAGLAQLGLRRGDRLGVFAHNGLDYLLAMTGAWRLGAIPALVNVRFADDLDYYFCDCTPKMIVYTGDHFDTVERHRKALAGSVERYLCLDGEQPGATDWAEVLDCSAAPPPDSAAEDDIAHLSYTSGTTGRPKGACLSHEPTARAARCIAERMRMTAADVSLGPTALSSSYQLVANLLPALSCSATCWVMNGWGEDGGLEVIGRIGATVLAANPHLLGATLDAARKARTSPPAAGTARTAPLTAGEVLPTAGEAPPAPDTSPPPAGEAGGSASGLPKSVRLALSGGGPAPLELKRAWQDELGVCIAESYGQSELGGFVGLGSPDPPPPGRLAACGRPLPDKEVRIVGEDDHEVPVGEVGEIVIRGGFMKGYWERPEQTAETLRGGWLRTGDVGRMDEEDYVFMRGRLSQRLTVRGEHWYPRDVEEALLRHPGVSDAALVGLVVKPDGGAGETAEGRPAPEHSPVAFVVMRGGDAASRGDELRSYAAADLAADLSPLHIRQIEAMPMTATGKIDYVGLLSLAADLMGAGPSGE